MSAATVALEALEAAEPAVEKHIGPIIVDMVSMAMAEGPTDPDVWIRALKGAVIYVETLKVDDQWLSSNTVYPRKP